MGELTKAGQLVFKLRYQGKQYSSGVRGANAGGHYLIDAANTIESLERCIAETKEAKMMDENRAELLQEDLDCVNMWLDDQSAPRSRDEAVLSIVGRIQALQTLAKTPAPVEQEWIAAEDFDPQAEESRGPCWIVVGGEVILTKYDVGGLFLMFNTRSVFMIEDIQYLRFVSTPNPPAALEAKQ